AAVTADPAGPVGTRARKDVPGSSCQLPPGACPHAGAGSASRISSPTRRNRAPTPALARDLRLFRQLIPRRLPLRHGEAGGARPGRPLGGARAAYLVVVPHLEAILLVDAILCRARPPEDVHRADEPALERLLGLGAGRVGLGQPLHPELAVTDVHLLLFEDALDGAHPGPVGAVAHVLQLMPGAAVHAEVEEDEVGPAVALVVEAGHAWSRGDARGADVGGAAVEAQREVVPGHVGGHVHAQILEEPV